jgi:group I intron endonuclease
MVYTLYLITNLVNGKYYVGWTNGTILERWKAHCWSAAQGELWYLSRSIRKYGKENFVVEVITIASSEYCIKEFEKLWIRALRSYDSEIGYNMTMGGDGWAGWYLLPEERKREILVKRNASLIERGKNPTQKMLDRPAKISATHKLNGIKPPGKPKGITDVEYYGEEKARVVADKLSKAVTGVKKGIWITNGITNCVLKSGPIPEGWRKGRTDKKHKPPKPQSPESNIKRIASQKARWAKRKENGLPPLTQEQITKFREIGRKGARVRWSKQDSVESKF